MSTVGRPKLFPELSQEENIRELRKRGKNNLRIKKRIAYSNQIIEELKEELDKVKDYDLPRSYLNAMIKITTNLLEFQSELNNST